MYCTKCGQSVPDNSVTCPICGAPLNAVNNRGTVSAPGNTGFNSGASAQPSQGSNGFNASQAASNISQKIKVNGVADFFNDNSSQNTSAYEKGKKIVPDCIKANEGEIPVKQYEIATLRNRTLGIPIAKAKGKIQVTNKRVIFRASGRAIGGKTVLQQEFEIANISGLEARKEYCFSGSNLFVGLISAFAASLVTFLFMLLMAILFRKAPALVYIIGTLALGLIYPLIKCKRESVNRLFCMGGIIGGLFGVGITQTSGFYLFLVLIAVLALFVFLFLYAILPQLVICIVNSGAQFPPICIKGEKKGGIGAKNGVNVDHTGYKEILPEEDAIEAIEELGAIIGDIKALGDFAVEKWKE